MKHYEKFIIWRVCVCKRSVYLCNELDHEIVASIEPFLKYSELRFVEYRHRHDPCVYNVTFCRIIFPQLIQIELFL